MKLFADARWSSDDVSIPKVKFQAICIFLISDDADDSHGLFWT